MRGPGAGYGADPSQKASSKLSGALGTFPNANSSSIRHDRSWHRLLGCEADLGWQSAATIKFGFSKAICATVTVNPLRLLPSS
jgi:hypothetical protein